ncbi:MAG: hypothetical protein ACRC1K_25545, partial [Planctomycetia bacterium]
MTTDLEATSKATANPRRKRRRWLRWLGGVLATVLVLLAVGFGWVYRQVAVSLPTLDGELRVAGVAAPLSIDRDDRGFPTITADTYGQALFGL